MVSVTELTRAVVMLAERLERESAARRTAEWRLEAAERRLARLGSGGGRYGTPRPYPPGREDGAGRPRGA